MNKQFSTNALTIIVSLLGVCSAIAPASAGQLAGGVVENVTKTTGAVEVGKTTTSAVQQTTKTAVGQVAGIVTDSKTTAEVKDPSQVKLPSLDNPTEIVQTTGQATVGIKTDQQSTQADAKADLEVEIADFAKVGICLDGNATLGIIKGASADCSKAVETPSKPVETLPVAVKTSYVDIKIPSVSVKSHSVPEPTSLGGIGLLGVYFIFRSRKIS